MIKYPKLFSPLKVGNLTLKNRIISAPTSQAELSCEGFLTPENIAYYELRAKGGAAVVTVGESIVHSATGQSHPKQIPLDKPRVLPSLYDCADAIHRHGAIASIELSHGGMECPKQFIKAPNPVGPVDTTLPNGTTVEAMSPELIAEVAESFGMGAKTVQTAGFDMVCVHAGHGWLLHQFLSPSINSRTDQFGGSTENRARFLLMALQSIRKHCPFMPIEVRLSGAELTENGMTIDETIQICRLIEPFVDALHISAGLHNDLFTSIIMHPSMFLEHGCNVYLAEAVRRAVNIPVYCVGGISDPDQMEEIISSGKADAVCLARALIADPYLPKKAKKGQDEDIRHCLRCYACQGQMFKTQNMRCTINPVIGRESIYNPPAAEKKKVAVIGGGPAGMQAAVTAAKRGHDVTLYEKSGSLGGALKFAVHIPFKADLHRFNLYLQEQIKKLGVKVCLNTDATLDFIDRLDCDTVIAAIGAEPVIPRFPGVDRVILGANMFDEGVSIGHKVVVIGGGLVGSEAALHLAQQGHEVTIVEMMDQLAPDAIAAHRRAMQVQMEKVSVDIRLSHKCLEITKDGVFVETPDGKTINLPADTVILAVGMKPLFARLDELRMMEKDFITIGDCVKPAKVMEAVRMGYDAAMDL